MAQGLLAPLICYQPVDTRQPSRDSDFRQLIDIAEAIDCFVPEESAYADDIYHTLKGRYVRRVSGIVKVIQERRNFDRPVMRSYIEALTRHKIAILVPDVTDLLDCNDFLMAALVAMNASFNLQILSLRLPSRTDRYEKQELSRRNVEDAKSEGGDGLNSLLKENSAICYGLAGKILARKAKQLPEIAIFQGIKGWTGGQRIGEIYRILDEVDPNIIEFVDDSMPPFERKRRRS